MPVHKWTAFDAGTFHDFCHSWIYEIHCVLNSGLLPFENYALIEPHLPTELTDALNHQGSQAAHTDQEFYRLKQSSVVVRHVDDDRLVAVIEIISPGNKSSRSAMRALCEKAKRLLAQYVHLLVIDLVSAGTCAGGIHGAIWQSVTRHPSRLPDCSPCTLAAYEGGDALTAVVEHAAVGDTLPSMPLYLRPRARIPLPLEDTYNSAFAAMPRRWRDVIAKCG